MKINMKRRMKRKLCRIAAWTVLVVVILVLAGFVAFAGLQISGKNSLGRLSGNSSPVLNLAGVAGRIENPELPGLDEAAETEDDWQEGDVRYQGIHYRYNADILTFLFLGIDKLEEVKPVENGMDGGQSDAIFLLVLNPTTRRFP